MRIDLAFDRSAGANPQPGLQDGRELSLLARTQVHHQLVAFVAANPGHYGAAATGRAGHYTKTVRLSAKPEHAAVAERAQCRDLSVLPGLPIEVPPKPRLALGHERLSQPLRLSLASGGPRWDRDDCGVPRIDGQSNEPCPGRPPDGAFEPPCRQPQRRAPFGRRRHRTRVAWDGTQPLAQRLAQPQNATQPSRHSNVLGIVWMPQ